MSLPLSELCAIAATPRYSAGSVFCSTARQPAVSPSAGSCAAVPTVTAHAPAGSPTVQEICAAADAPFTLSQTALNSSSCSYM
eukprot:SAG31_NODE_25488_length_460_cov_0.817175_1_plen_82_part_10